MAGVMASDVEINVRANTQQAKQAIDELKGATDRASASLDKKKTSAINAGGAVTSFGRIIQDAPFGIIGVANNITTLSEQFVSLKMQAGGTTAALQAMKASLFGPLGLTVAISAITTALQVWAMQSHKTKKAVDALGDSVKRLVEFKNPFENFVLKFDTNNIANAISQVNYELGTVNNRIKSVTGAPTAEELMNPDVMSKRAGQMYRTQKELIPRRAILEKLRDYLLSVKKEIDVDSQVFKELNTILKSGLDSEKDKPFSTPGDASNASDKIKIQKEKNLTFLEMIKDEVELTLEIDNLSGRKTGRSVYENYLKIIGDEIQSGKLSQTELRDWLRLRKEVNEEMAKDYKATEYLRTEGFDTFFGLDKGTMKGMQKYGKTKAKEELKEKLSAEKAAAKEQYQNYKDFFIDPFVNSFRGEFSKAWNDIFGEATSLFEKFIQGVGEALFQRATGNLATNILRALIPGSGLVFDLFGAGGGDKKQVTQLIIDGELLATAKMANRNKAILDRTAALR